MIDKTLATERTTIFNGKEITITELTVAQVRKIMTKLEQANSLHLLDDMIDSVIPAIAIAESSGLQIEEIEKHKPSVINELAREVEQSNPFFVGMVKRRMQVYENMKKVLGKQKEAVSAPSTIMPVN